MPVLDHVILNSTNYDIKDAKAQAMLAPTEASSTASAAHAKGSYFIYGGVLYVATADITSGDTITPNTNCVAATVGGEVSDLKSAMDDITQGIATLPLNLSIVNVYRFYSRKIQKAENVFPLTLSCSNNDYSFSISYYTAEDVFVSNTVWKKGDYILASADFPETAGYMCMVGKKDSESALSNDEKQYFSAHYDIPIFDGFKSYVDGEIAEIDAIIGTTALPTVAQTLTGAIAEVDDKTASIVDAINGGATPVELALTTSPSTRFNSRHFSKSENIYPLTFKCTNQDYSFYIAYYKADNTFISTTVWKKGEYTITTDSYPDEGTYCIMTCKADDEHELSDAEKAYFSAYYVLQVYKDVETLKQDVETLKQKEQIFYVATSGNDGNDGSKASPFKTIAKALSENATYIFVVPGTYSERLNLSGKSHLTIAPYYPSFNSSDFAAKIVLDGINTRPYLIEIADCQDITLVGIKVINFTNSGFKVVNSTDMQFINCEAADQYGTYQYGIGFELIKTDVIFNDCIAHDVELDGFNFHDYGTCILNNCVAYNCGDDGVSHHDACVGHIIGGEWYNCGKGGIASPTYGAYVDISGAYIHDNLYGIYTGNASGRRNCKARINNCVAKNNTNYDIVISGTDAIGWQNIYSTKSVASGASFTELD